MRILHKGKCHKAQLDKEFDASKLDCDKVVQVKRTQVFGQVFDTNVDGNKLGVLLWDGGEFPN